MLPVEKVEGLAGKPRLHGDARLEGGEIVRVHRLAELQHDVVGDVHDRVNGSDTATAQPLAQPQRRSGVGAQAADDAAGKTRAVGRIRH